MQPTKVLVTVRRNNSPLQKCETTGTSFLYQLDWKSKNFNWNVTEWKATQPRLRVFSGNCSNGSLAKVAKLHTNPYNFVVCLPNPQGPSWTRHWHELATTAWERATQELGKYIMTANFSYLTTYYHMTTFMPTYMKWSSTFLSLYIWVCSSIK